MPQLGELRLHNGTVYRWNRPVYDVMNGRPHLRVENRVLPAGPTVVDMLANAAFYFGLVRELAEADRPIWSQLTFSAAEENFHAAAREASTPAVLARPRRGAGHRPGAGPSCCRGVRRLDRFGVDPGTRDRLLGIIEQRCRTGRNGAAWQTEAVDDLEARHHLDRRSALREMLQRYASGCTPTSPCTPGRFRPGQRRRTERRPRAV